MKIKEVIRILIIFLIVVGGVMFLIDNFATYQVYGISDIKQKQIYEKSEQNIKNIIPVGWEIQKFSSANIKKVGNDYRLYVEVKNNLIGKWTNDLIIVNENGLIIEESIVSNMEFWEESWQYWQERAKEK